MIPEDLLFWISPIADAPTDDPNVLCRRHADAMVVPRGWTLDDRREDTLRLFKPQALVAAVAAPSPPRRSRSRPAPGARPEQLQIDGTGEIERPGVPVEAAPVEVRADEPPLPWQPDFDADDDLDGLLEVSSPLLARAFRGTGRPKS